MLRSWPLPLAVALLLAVPAGAADQSVQARPDSTFSPQAVEIDLGDKVMFSNGGGFHNVRWDDGQVVEQPADPDSGAWSFERTFDEPGVHRYYCEAHGGPGGSGMSGQVSVRDATGQVPEPVDEPAPGLTLSTKKTQSLAKVLEAVRVKARCTGGCLLSLGVFDGERAVGGKSVQLEADDPARAVDIRLKKKARRRLAKRTKKFKLRVEGHALNTGGDHTIKRTITVTP